MSAQVPERTRDRSAPLAINRLIGERAEIEFRQVEAHHRLSHEEADQLFLWIDPVLGLRRSRPAELAHRPGRPEWGDIEQPPRAKAEARAGQGQAADVERQERRWDEIRVQKLERLAPEDL